MNEIKLYDFVDCLLVDMNVGRLLSSLFVIAEAYYPIVQNIAIRKKGLIKVTFNRILSLNLKKIEEFDVDILRDYSDTGDDIRANEIYSIMCKEKGYRELEVTLNSDFLQFELTCSDLEVLEIEKW